MTLIEQLNAHPRLSNVRAAFHEFFDRDDVRVRAIVSGEGWSDRVITWVTITNELWESDDAATVIPLSMIDFAERWVERQQ